MDTPAQIALEFGVSQKRVRDLLRDLYGTLPQGVSRWELDDDRAARVRSRLLERSPQRPEWSLEIGDTVLRRAIHDTFGGQDQGGISTPRSIPEILIFTDPKSGAKYGYDKFEGFREDGSYWYTGEGQTGPQLFVRGNRALRDAAIDGKVIRLLTKSGTSATYVGAFTNGDPTYRLETIPDIQGRPREGIIFNLVPLEADVRLLPVFGGEPRTSAATLTDWAPPEYSDVVVESDGHAPAGERVVSRAEFELQADFGKWLAAKSDPPKRLRLPIAGVAIEPDLYVPSRAWIVEAKKSTARAYIRAAIGQVLDYVHIATGVGIDASAVVLLPSAPQSDLVGLMHGLGITIAHRDESGFAILAPEPSE